MEASRLEQVYLDAVEDRFQAKLGLGLHRAWDELAAPGRKYDKQRVFVQAMTA